MEATLKSNVKVKQKAKIAKLNMEIPKKIIKEGLKFLFVFLMSRTSILFTLTPFAPSIMLASGGGIIAFLGAVLGAYTQNSFEAVFYVVTAFLVGFFLKNEKFNTLNLFISGTIVYTSIITQTGFSLYDIIMSFMCVLIAGGSYYPLKIAYKAHFFKSKALKFTKKETYCSVLALFCLIAGLKDFSFYFIDIGNILKIYIITLCAYCMGIGTGASVGTVFGLLSGNSYKDASTCMAIYSFMGMMEGIFAKFSKFTTILGGVCAYTFTYIYMQDYLTMLKYKELIIASVLFMLTPKKLIDSYCERFTKKENTLNMLSTVNSVLANRLDSLSKSFFSLSEKINIMPSKNNSMANLNTNSLCDFLCEKVCSKCSLKHFCWDKQYDNTVSSLTAGMKVLSEKGTIKEDDFNDYFKGHCTKIPEILSSCKSFHDILKVNTVWKRKMTENSRAFKQQFIEMSEIICDMKKSIETNKYYEAELSSEIYSAISYEGYIVRDVFVIKDATGAFFVQIALEHCYEKKSCCDVIKGIIEEVLGTYVTKCEGGCSDKMCNLMFREGSVGKLEKRVYSISKKQEEPAGDSYIVKKISPNKYLAAICDGMGSGKDAHEISSCVTGLLTDMLASGFSEEVTYRMINSFVLANLSGLGFTTMDFAVIDTKTMMAKIVKKGACPTYIKRNKKEIISIENKSMPAGIVWQKPFVKTIHLMKGDIIVMASDGAIEALPDKNWIKNMLNKNMSHNLNECIDLIYSVAQQDCDKKEDDMTVLGLCVS